MLAAADEVVPDDAGVVGGEDERRIVGRWRVMLPQLPEIDMRAADRVDFSEVAGGEGPRGGERVERVAPGDDAAEVPAREVLPQEEEAVAEVVVRLARIPLRQRPAPDVVDLACGLDADAPPRPPQPPAEVDLFHVHHEPLVQQPDVVERGATEEEGRARRPENVAGVVVLPRIALDGVEDPAARERVGVAVEEAAARPGVLEPAAVGVLQQLRLHGGDVGLRFHRFDERRQPARRHLDVVVEQADVVARRVRDRLVVAPAEQPVLRVPHHVHGGERRGDPFGRAVRRRVVREDDLEVGVVRGDDGREALPEERQRVPTHDDDGDAGERHGANAAGAGNLRDSRPPCGGERGRPTG